MKKDTGVTVAAVYKVGATKHRSFSWGCGALQLLPRLVLKLGGGWGLALLPSPLASRCQLVLLSSPPGRTDLVNTTSKEDHPKNLKSISKEKH